MRRVLFAMVIVLGLTAAIGLLGVKLIPEDALRARVTEEMRQALGRSVIVAGDTELRLLPQPHLLVRELVFTEGGPRLTVDRTELRLAPLAWLTGGARVAGVSVDGLRIAAQGGDGAALAGLLPDLDLPARLDVSNARLTLDRPGRERLRISDGTFAFRRRADGMASLDGRMDVNGLATSLSVVIDRRDLLAAAPADLAAAGVGAAAVPVDLVVTAGPTRLAWRGSLAAASRQGALAELGFDGWLDLTVSDPGALAGRLDIGPAAARAMPGPLAANGRIAVAPGRLVLDGLEVVAADLRARAELTVAGTLADGAAPPRLTGSLILQRLDLPSLAALWPALPPDWRRLEAPLPLGGQVALAVPAITQGRTVLGEATGILEIDPDRLSLTVSRLMLGGGRVLGHVLWRAGPSGDAEPAGLTATALLDAVDLDRLWRDLAVPVALSGSADGELSLSLSPAGVAALTREAPDAGEALAGLSGRGELSVAGARFVVPGGTGRQAIVRFERVEARARLDGPSLDLSPIRVAAGPVDLSGEGSIDLAAGTVAIDLRPSPGDGAGPAGEGPLGEGRAEEGRVDEGMAAGGLRIEGPLRSPYAGPLPLGTLPVGGGGGGQVDGQTGDGNGP